MSRRLKALADSIERIGYRVLGGLLAGMSLIIAWQVFQRYVLGVTHAWTEEAALYAMMWLGLVGAALGLRRGSHIAIAYFTRKLEGAAGRAVAALVWCSEALFALFLLVYGWRLSRAFLTESSPGTGIPAGIIYLALPLGGALMMLFLVEQASLAWARRRS